MPRLSVSGQKQPMPIIPMVMAIGNGVIQEINLVSQINENVKWDNRQWEVSPGDLAKALILSTLSDMRSPLHRISSRFKGVDAAYLFGEGVKATQINEFNVGRMLDRLSEIDCGGFYQTVALNVMTLYQTGVKRLHADTTTISFYGEYDFELSTYSEAEQEAILKIVRGYNKDGKPQCNQVVVGQITTEDGIPLTAEVMDGNTSDIDWNEKGIEHCLEIQKHLGEGSIYVADSKLICEKHFQTLMRNGVLFVSRCPANFAGKLESRMIEKAWELGTWEDLGKYGQGKKASMYQGIGLNEKINGYPTRLLVVRSSALADKVSEHLSKALSDAEELARSVEKKQFKCLPDVKEELNRFAKDKRMKLFQYTCEIDEIQEEKWPRGRRRTDGEPLSVKTSCQIRITGIEENPEAVDQYRKNETCIVVISNLLEETDNQTLLGIYKGQQVVENSFRLLKDPAVASVIYLNNENRIRALTCLLHLALLVRAILQDKMRKGFSQWKTEHPKEELKAGWGTKNLEAPTYKLLFEHCRGIQYVKTGSDCYELNYYTDEDCRKITILLSLMGLSAEVVLG